MANEDRHGERTVAGNMRALPLDLVCSSISQTLESILEEEARKSLLSCGILNSIDKGDSEKIVAFSKGNKAEIQRKSERVCL